MLGNIPASMLRYARAPMHRSVRITHLVLALALMPSCDKLKGGDDGDAKSADATPEAKSSAETKTEAKTETETKEAPVVTAAITCPDGGTAKGAAPPTGHELWCEKDVGGKPMRHGRWTRWHDGTDKRWHEQEYREGKLHGASTSWHENGQKSEEGAYKDDLKDGHFTSWGEDAAKRNEGDFRAGKKHGRWVDFWPNGKPREETEYKDDVQDGRYVSYDESGKRVVEGTYVAGKKHGTWTTIAADGTKTDETWKDGVREDAPAGGFTCPAGLELDGPAPPKGNVVRCIEGGEHAQGPYVKWFDNTGKTIQIQGQYDHGQKDGRWIENYPDGDPKEETEYRADKREGEHVAYWKNDQKRIEGEYWENKRQGMWHWWFGNGQRWMEGEYKRGKKQGEWTQFFEDGDRQIVENYKNDERDGRAEYFDDKGELIAVGEWRADKKSGKWRLFVGGKVVEEMVFKDDRPVTPTRRPFPKLPELAAD
jgi:antitoxin component YwqK of YwqJK toxin-antitoxin module